MTAWVAIFLTTATTSAVAGLAAGRATDRAARSAGAAYLVARGGWHGGGGGDDPRHPGLHSDGRAGAALPRAGPARDLGRPGALARGPRRAARPALAGPVQLARAWPPSQRACGAGLDTLCAMTSTVPFQYLARRPQDASGADSASKALPR